MPLQQVTTPYGPPAFRALRAAVDQLQAGDPLASITVLVHSNAVGVAARRWLAANGGIAAAQFLTAFRFADNFDRAISAEQGAQAHADDFAVVDEDEADAGFGGGGSGHSAVAGWSGRVTTRRVPSPG